MGPKVAEWVKTVIDGSSEKGDANYELVDVAEFKLPLFDEPVLPAMVHDIGMFVLFCMLLLRFFMYTPNERKIESKELKIATSRTSGTYKRNRNLRQGTYEEVGIPHVPICCLHLCNPRIQLRHSRLDEKRRRLPLQRDHHEASHGRVIWSERGKQFFCESEDDAGRDETSGSEG